jgi:hypothetical protein
MSRHPVCIDEIREATSNAIREVLKKYGVRLNGHSLNASDNSAELLAGQLRDMAENGKLLVQNDRQQRVEST